MDKGTGSTIRKMDHANDMIINHANDMIINQAAQAEQINQVPDNIGLALSILDTPRASMPIDIITTSSRDDDSHNHSPSDNNDSDSDDSEVDQYYTQNREYEDEVHEEEPLLFPLEIEYQMRTQEEKCSAVFKGYEDDDDYVRVTSPSPTGDSNESIETTYTYAKFLDDFKPLVTNPSDDGKENIQPLLTLGVFTRRPQDDNPGSVTLNENHLSTTHTNRKQRKG